MGARAQPSPPGPGPAFTLPSFRGESLGRCKRLDQIDTGREELEMRPFFFSVLYHQIFKLNYKLVNF